jgi:phosphoribosylformimino-5-aminoimidazole carboxamide ribotide isomerase
LGKSLDIIPAIDLMKGRVVHARRGQRDRYQPISTPLCRDPEPFAVIDALLRLHPFQTLYIADLDALMQQGAHDALLAQLTQAYPQVMFWVDQGLAGGAIPPRHGNNCVTVVGSESLDADTATTLLAQSQPNFILSLDYARGVLIGPHLLLELSHAWPKTVIVMNLSRVGSNSGPDLRQLEQFVHRWPDNTFVAAGGVRGTADLLRLDKVGVAAALVASALHDGGLGAAALQRLKT